MFESFELFVGQVIDREFLLNNLAAFHYKKVNKSNFIGGILIPLLFAFFFGQTLIDIFPGLTFID